jgi:hypothetical protein
MQAIGSSIDAGMSGCAAKMRSSVGLIAAFAIPVSWNALGANTRCAIGVPINPATVDTGAGAAAVVTGVMKSSLDYGTNNRAANQTRWRKISQLAHGCATT